MVANFTYSGPEKMAMKAYAQFTKAPSDCLVSYPRLSLGESYPSSNMQSVYPPAPIRCYYSGPEWERWQWRGTPNSPKLQHYWTLTIRLFRVISRTLVRESYRSVEMQSVFSTAPADWAIRRRGILKDILIIKKNVICRQIRHILP